MLSRINIIYYITISITISLTISRLGILGRKSWASGQVFLEYALIISLIVAAIVGMQLYLQRGLQGRYKAATDYALKAIGAAQDVYRPLTQYDPYYDMNQAEKGRVSQIQEFYDQGESAKIIFEQNQDISAAGQSLRVIPPFSTE